jgi:hypothetical protein
VGECVARLIRAGLVADPAGELCGTRPIGLNRENSEAVPLDEAAGDGGTDAIKLAGPVGGQPEQDHARVVREPVEAGAECLPVVQGRQRPGVDERMADAGVLGGVSPSMGRVLAVVFVTFQRG